jgi:hypothetical protein
MQKTELSVLGVPGRVHAFSAKAATTLVEGPGCFEAGGVYLPGFMQGQDYNPGLQAGQTYHPGFQAAQRDCH